MALAVEVVLSDLICEAVQGCVEYGYAPMEAAKDAPIASLCAEDVLALAVLGMARLVNNALRAHNHALMHQEDRKQHAARPLRSEVFDSGSQEARRQVLYERTMDALLAVFQAADGSMRTLRDFTADDHRHRLTVCECKGRGWRRSARFHQEVLTMLKVEAADCIGELSADMQERARGLLR